MQDIIRRIVEMDEDARRIKEKAEQEKVQAKADIAAAQEQIHNEYIERARLRALKNNDNEQKAADEQWEKTREKHDLIKQAMEKEFSENYDAWVDSVVSNVLQQI